MQLTRGVQECLLALLMYDTAAAQQVRAAVDVSAFDTYYDDFAKACIAFLNDFDAAPGEHTSDILDKLCERQPKNADFYGTIYDAATTTYEGGFESEYIIRSAAAFGHHQAIKEALSRTLDEIEKDTEDGTNEAKHIMHDVLRKCAEVKTRNELLLNDPKQALQFLAHESSAMPTGIPEIDARDGGPKRKTLHCFAAPAKCGKSWWLANLAKHCMLGGLKVAIVTLEMSEILYAQRLIQAFFSVSKRKGQNLMRVAFEKDDIGRYTSQQEVEIGDRPSLRDDDIEAVLTKMISKTMKNRPDLRIVQFPTGSASVRDIAAWLDEKESLEGFIPDIVIVDYADLLELPDPKQLRQSLLQIYTDLRGLAVKRNIAIATATQMSKEGANKKRGDEKDAAEAYGKVAIVDALIAYNQTEEEREHGLARLLAAAMREDDGRYEVLISQAYAVGQFALDSVMMNQQYWTDMTPEEDDE